jgi:radical SAM superfamily enzyme YgiQ (UPF0313 family)
MVEQLIVEIDAFKPDIVGLSALTDDYPLGRALMKEVRRIFPSIPTIAGGVHATVDPAGVIAEDCFDMVCVGEGEYVALDLGKRVDSKEGFENIANIWLKNPDGIIERNPVRPYEQDLDKLPPPDWSIYSPTAFYKPFLGYVYKYGDFEMSRGCPYKCSYCINVQLQEIYRSVSGGHSYHREKTIPRVIKEISQAIETYGIEFLKFWDETFLLMGKERMEEFADLYSSRIGLPYVIETTAQSLTPFSAQALKRTNCRSASLGMETGSMDLRMGILHKTTDNKVYVDAYKLLEDNGVQKVSFNMIGLPNESQADIFRTIALNRLVTTESQSLGIFYPYKGTPIREWMVSQGWMGEDFDLRNLEDYDFTTLTAGIGSVVRFKDMDSKLLQRIYSLFSSYIFWPVKLWPLLDYVRCHDDSLAAAIIKTVKPITYFRKFGEWPPSTNASSSPVLEPPPDLGEAEANELAQLIVEHWNGRSEELAQVVDILSDISECRVSPEFPIPTSADELKKWLGIGTRADSETLSSHREVRSKMRFIARENVVKYR